MRLQRNETLSNDELFASVVLDLICGRRKVKKKVQEEPTEAHQPQRGLVFEEPSLTREKSSVDVRHGVKPLLTRSLTHLKRDPSKKFLLSDVPYRTSGRNLLEIEEAPPGSVMDETVFQEPEDGLDGTEEGEEEEEEEEEKEPQLLDILRESYQFQTGSGLQEEQDQLGRNLTTGPGEPSSDSAVNGATGESHDQSLEESHQERVARIRVEYRRKWRTRRPVASTGAKGGKADLLTDSELLYLKFDLPTQRVSILDRLRFMGPHFRTTGVIQVAIETGNLRPSLCPLCYGYL